VSEALVKSLLKETSLFGGDLRKLTSFYRPYFSLASLPHFLSSSDIKDT
jgi:hypothetical protein